jgi:hypothetical protein
MPETEAMESLSHSGFPASMNRFLTSLPVDFPCLQNTPDTLRVCFCRDVPGTGKRRPKPVSVVQDEI